MANWRAAQSIVTQPTYSESDGDYTDGAGVEDPTSGDVGSIPDPQTTIDVPADNTPIEDPSMSGGVTDVGDPAANPSGNQPSTGPGPSGVGTSGDVGGVSDVGPTAADATGTTGTPDQAHGGSSDNSTNGGILSGLGGVLNSIFNSKDKTGTGTVNSSGKAKPIPTTSKKPSTKPVSSIINLGTDNSGNSSGLLLVLLAGFVAYLFLKR